jgi:HK97 gp10 family phage protein
MALKRQETVTVVGLKELEQALLELPSKATQRNVLKRVLLKAAKPIADAMQQNAEHFRKTGVLEESINVGTKLTTRQQTIKKRDKRQGGNANSNVEVYAGAGKVGYAHLKEFGDSQMAADPYARPAWDSNRHQALETIKTDLWGEIKKAAERAARKSLRKGRKK